jgi:hypothetical protein
MGSFVIMGTQSEENWNSARMATSDYCVPSDGKINRGKKTKNNNSMNFHIDDVAIVASTRSIC